MTEVFIKHETEDRIYFVSSSVYPRFLERLASNRTSYEPEIIINKLTGKVMKNRYGAI